MIKRAILFVVIALFMFSAVSASPPRHSKHSDAHWYKSSDNNISMDFDDGTLVITNRGRNKGKVEITKDYELYVNGRRVQTNDEQRELLREYYKSVEDLVDYAAEVGFEGAKIGAQGAEIGIAAVAGLFHLLSSDYDTDDLERELERKSDRLEMKAERLEEKAEALEEQAEELEELADELNDEIPELHRLRWF
jgi:cell division protein ZapA (FtsZ GTPase activity inhibitor)